MAYVSAFNGFNENVPLPPVVAKTSGPGDPSAKVRSTWTSVRGTPPGATTRPLIVPPGASCALTPVRDAPGPAASRVASAGDALSLYSSAASPEPGGGMNDTGQSWNGPSWPIVQVPSGAVSVCPAAVQAGRGGPEA